MERILENKGNKDLGTAFDIILEEWINESAGDEELEDSFDLEEDTDEEYDVETAVMAFFYLRAGFKRWLVDQRNLTKKSANDYLRKFDSLYDALSPLVGYDIYEMLAEFLDLCPDLPIEDDSEDKEDWKKIYGYDLNAYFANQAPGLVNTYIMVLKNEMEKDARYSRTDLRVLETFHAYIVDISASSDAKYLKPKASPLPDEEEFLNWLMSSYNDIDYDRARKIVSSIKRLDLIAPSLVRDPISFLDVLRALPDNGKRENYIIRVHKRMKHIHRTLSVTSKTISNEMSNARIYARFLNRK
ncbi:MAG: hypothetical protein K2H18_00810 [Muribaculaceae bacterium]|nr:hypothetical protein [Muribaculaceae bacterium]